MAAAQSGSAAGGFANGQAASQVLGQQDFVTNTAATTSGSSLNVATAVAVDASGNVWVADFRNYRVVQFAAPFTNGESAVVVLGQPDFTSNAQNNGGRTASSLGGPIGLAIDPSGNVWVADGAANGRILRYSPPFTNFMAASLVLGVPNFTSVTSGPSQTSVGRPGGGGPEGLAFDSSGNIWVADTDNHRVLRFNAPFTNGQPASLVLGQPNFTSGSAATSPTASSLNHPQSVTVDSSGNVWVADRINNRVLRYSPPFTNGQAASLVVGQTLFNSNSAPTPPTASSVRGPTGVTVDSSGSLWIVESDNRILGYDPPFANGQAAATVIGQSDFVSNSAPNPTASSLRAAGPVAFAGRQMWVADAFNNRVLAYVSPFLPGPDPTPPGGTARPVPLSPPDFPLKTTIEWGCAESLAGRCLREEIVRLCIGGNCFTPLPPPTPPICARCHLGAGVAAGAALGALGVFLLVRRRRP